MVIYWPGTPCQVVGPGGCWNDHHYKKKYINLSRLYQLSIRQQTITKTSSRISDDGGLRTLPNGCAIYVASPKKTLTSLELNSSRYVSSLNSWTMNVDCPPRE